MKLLNIQEDPMSMTREEIIKAYEDAVVESGLAAAAGNEDAAKSYELFKAGLSALRPISRGQIEQNKRRWEVQTSISPYYYCSGCGELFEIHSYDKEKYRFCPYCMSPMTDEAVDIMLKRMEALLND